MSHRKVGEIHTRSLPLYPHLTSCPPFPWLGLLRPRSRTMPRHLLTNSCHPLRPFCYHPTLTPLLLPIPLTPLSIPWLTSQLQRKSDQSWLLLRRNTEYCISYWTILSLVLYHYLLTLRNLYPEFDSHRQAPTHSTSTLQTGFGLKS